MDIKYVSLITTPKNILDIKVFDDYKESDKNIANFASKQLGKKLNALLPVMNKYTGTFFDCYEWDNPNPDVEDPITDGIDICNRVHGETLLTTDRYIIFRVGQANAGEVMVVPEGVAGDLEHAKRILTAKYIQLVVDFKIMAKRFPKIGWNSEVRSKDDTFQLAMMNTADKYDGYYARILCYDTVKEQFVNFKEKIEWETI